MQISPTVIFQDEIVIFPINADPHISVLCKPRHRAAALNVSFPVRPGQPRAGQRDGRPHLLRAEEARLPGLAAGRVPPDCGPGRGPAGGDAGQRGGQPLRPLRDDHRESEGPLDPPRQWPSLQPHLQPAQGDCELKYFPKLKLKYFQEAGKDDETGEPLVQREDDKPESVRNRLEVFQVDCCSLIGQI